MLTPESLTSGQIGPGHRYALTGRNDLRNIAGIRVRMYQAAHGRLLYL
jgi:hypothetical protein